MARTKVMVIASNPRTKKVLATKEIPWDTDVGVEDGDELADNLLRLVNEWGRSFPKDTTYHIEDIN